MGEEKDTLGMVIMVCEGGTQTFKDFIHNPNPYVWDFQTVNMQLQMKLDHLSHVLVKAQRKKVIS